MWKNYEIHHTPANIYEKMASCFKRLITFIQDFWDALSQESN